MREREGQKTIKYNSYDRGEEKRKKVTAREEIEMKTGRIENGNFHTNYIQLALLLHSALLSHSLSQTCYFSHTFYFRMTDNNNAKHELIRLDSTQS